MRLLLIIPIHFTDKQIKYDFIERMKSHIEPILEHDTILDVIDLPEGATPCIECRIDRNQNAPLVASEIGELSPSPPMLLPPVPAVPPVLAPPPPPAA